MSKTLTNQYSPDEVSPPGETLLETLDGLGMTQAELAARTGRPIKTINEIIKGKTAITPETALQLERVLGVRARFWNNRERHYRDALARQAERVRLGKQVSWLKEVPVRQMIRRGWIRAFVDKIDQLREVLSFFGVASPDEWQSVWSNMRAHFRHSKSFQSDPVATSMWLRKGEIEGQNIRCDDYDDVKFRHVLDSARELTRNPPNEFVPELQDMCRHAGVVVAFVPALPKVRTSGATQWISPKKALIQLSLRHKSDDHLWFSFYHEAAHILYDGKKDIFVDGGVVEDKSERKADRFAERTLVPERAYRRFVQERSPRWSKQAIIRFAGDIGVSPGIVVGRLQHDGYLPLSHCNALKRRLEWLDA